MGKEEEEGEDEGETTKENPNKKKNEHTLYYSVIHITYNNISSY